MIIRKKPARPHGLNEPFVHENHPRPVTRRQLLGAGFLTGPAVVLAPAWLGSLLKSQTAEALDATITNFKAECKIAGSGAGSGPLGFITIDLAGGANLIGSEALVGAAGAGGQIQFLSAAGYSRLGLPGTMVPTATANIDNTLGLLFHSDSAIARGIKVRAQGATTGGVSGVVIPAMSQNDTGNNPLNAMYGIAKAAAGIPGATAQFGSLLTLCGTQSSVSGGNSASPATYIDPTLQPTKIASAVDDTGLVSTSGAAPSQDTLAALASQAKISTGTVAQSTANVTNSTPDPAAFASSTINTTLITGATPAAIAADAALKEQVRCAYTKTAYTADQFGSPSSLNPDLDPNIVGASGIFTTAENADSDFKKTAAVMKLVVNGYAGAGTITLGGYDYHDSTRASGETKNQKAGQVIGAILDYARRQGRAIMIQVISDGSLNSTGSVDSSTAGRNKLGWQGDAQQTAASFILAYSPKGRPTMNAQQIGFMNADGTVNAASSPAANANNLLVQMVMLNWMAANGTVGNFDAIFPMQGLGAMAARVPYVAFNQIT
jgi:hypothetical protein